jgi:hypothetical protein
LGDLWRRCGSGYFGAKVGNGSIRVNVVTRASGRQLFGRNSAGTLRTSWWQCDVFAAAAHIQHFFYNRSFVCQCLDEIPATGWEYRRNANTRAAACCLSIGHPGSKSTTEYVLMTCNRFQNLTRKWLE